MTLNRSYPRPVRAFVHRDRVLSSTRAGRPLGLLMACGDDWHEVGHPLCDGLPADEALRSAIRTSAGPLLRPRRVAIALWRCRYMPSGAGPLRFAHEGGPLSATLLLLA